jgi:hypothetical protein
LPIGCSFDHADRNPFLQQFVNHYNHTRLKCLGYAAPKQILANLTGLNTQAGIGVGGLLNQPFKVHHLVGHRCFLVQVGVRNPTHNRRIIDDRPQSRPPLQRD